MPPVRPSDGPVAVTGAAGFIGSHIVQNLVRHGYTVRACVRDPTRRDKTAHLLLMNSEGPGSVTLARGDLEVEGSYDEAVAGTVCVFHAAAELGNNSPDATPESVYRLGLVATRWVMDSIRKAKTVKRIVYTSSLAAVTHPAPEGYRYTEASWASMHRPPEHWNMEVVKRNRDVAYAMSKEHTEKYLYEEAAKLGIEAMGVNPCHVLGPLLAAHHCKDWAWQTKLRDQLSGVGFPPMMWNVIDVRDVAEAQRLVAESMQNRNGDRYNLVAANESGFLSQEQIQSILRRFYPGCGIGGISKQRPQYYGPVCYLEKCITQLGLKPHTVEDTLRANCDSCLAWGLAELRAGEDNWQRQGKDLGIKSMMMGRPYPAVDPLKKKLPPSKLSSKL